MNTKRILVHLLLVVIPAILCRSDTFGQNKNLLVRIAKLEIDSSQLDGYKAALKEHAETAVHVEAGVLNLYAVYEKNNPTHVIVFEIYADSSAYLAHLQSPHFLKYKHDTKDMVKSLQLIETVPIALETKI